MSDNDSSVDESPEVPAVVWLTRLHQRLSGQDWVDFKNALNRTPDAFLLVVEGGGAKKVLSLLSQNGHRDIAVLAAKTLGERLP